MKDYVAEIKVESLVKNKKKIIEKPRAMRKENSKKKKNQERSKDQIPKRQSKMSKLTFNKGNE